MTDAFVCFAVYQMRIIIGVAIIVILVIIIVSIVRATKN